VHEKYTKLKITHDQKGDVRIGGKREDGRQLGNRGRPNRGRVPEAVPEAGVDGDASLVGPVKVGPCGSINFNYYFWQFFATFDFLLSNVVMSFCAYLHK
jgi:hypothetical protein